MSFKILWSQICSLQCHCPSWVTRPSSPGTVQAPCLWLAFTWPSSWLCSLALLPESSALVVLSSAPKHLSCLGLTSLKSKHPASPGLPPDGPAALSPPWQADSLKPVAGPSLLQPLPPGSSPPSESCLCDHSHQGHQRLLVVIPKRSSSGFM